MDEVENLSTISEEVNSSTGMIESTVKELNTNAEKDSTSALKIRDKAMNVKGQGENAVKNAKDIYSGIIKNVKSAIEQGKVVEDVRIMADSIAEISEQTKDTVERIKKVIQEVKVAFDNLSSESRTVLDFLQNDVNKDYELLIETATSYVEDSQLISSMSDEIKNTSNTITQIINNIAKGINTVSSTSLDTAGKSQEIKSSMDEAAYEVNNILKSIKDQSNIADELTKVIEVYTV